MATKIAERAGYEVWSQYDASAGVFELFASEATDDYLGAVDTLAEARAFAAAWIAERITER